jgi:hypothetical protein
VKKMVEKMKTIKITKSQKQKLDNLKIIPQEPYYHTIEKILQKKGETQ